MRQSVFLAFSCAALMGCSPPSSIGQESSNVPAKESEAFARQLAKAQSLLRQKRYQQAQEQLQQLTHDFPEQLRPRFLLGYALQAQKKYDEAMKSYQLAAKSPRFNSFAEYNMACICALQKKGDEAFDHLETAIQAGFSNFEQLAKDPDLASLREDQRFAKLIPPRLPDAELFIEPTRILHSMVGENAGDQFGWTARRAGDWDDDGVMDFVTTAPTHAGAGKVYVYSSKVGSETWTVMEVWIFC